MRLIKRITSLRLIINAAVSSLPSLTWALLMLALLEATFAIIAANTWGAQEPTLATFTSALFSVTAAAALLRLGQEMAAWRRSAVAVWRHGGVAAWQRLPLLGTEGNLLKRPGRPPGGPHDCRDAASCGRAHTLGPVRLLGPVRWGPVRWGPVRWGPVRWGRMAAHGAA